MKKNILAVLSLLLLSCSKTEESPKKVFMDFFINLKKLNFQKAEGLLGANSKKDFELIKNEFQKSSIFAEEIEKIKTIKDEDIIKGYYLDSLIEVISETNAIVMTKDSLIKISLEKIDNSWKIVAHPRMIEDILFESTFKKAVFDKLKDLEQAFETRNNFINTNLKQSKDSDKVVLLNELKRKTSSLQKMNNDNIYNPYFYYKIQNNIDSTLVNNFSTQELDAIYTYLGKAKGEFNDAIYNYNIRTIGRRIKFFPAFEVQEKMVAPTVKF